MTYMNVPTLIILAGAIWALVVIIRRGASLEREATLAYRRPTEKHHDRKR